MDDLTTRDQRMMFAVMTLAITADTKEQLDSDTEAVLSVARKHMCQLAVLKFQQLDGLNTALPIGARKINAFRTLTTESLAVFIPFKVQEIQDKGGIYFGENAISHNLIMCNKANLLNQSAFLLGVPGAGKSFSAKELIAFLMLHPDYANDDILICDPEGEFGALVKALGREKATVAHLVAGGKDRLNAMYMVEGYGEQNPIVEKSQFVMSLIEQIDKRGVGPQHKSIIDRCTALVYPEAEKSGRVATLCDLRNKLLEQPEDIVMLNQAASDRAKLAKLLNISNEQMSYVTNADAGCGLIRYHLHVVYVPVVEKQILWSKRCKDKSLVGTVKETIMQVSSSKKWLSKPALDEQGAPILQKNGKPVLRKSYSVLQDDFFQAMRNAGYSDVERGERGSSEEHLTVTQFKVEREQERLEQLTAQTQQKEQQAASLEKKIEKIQKQQIAVQEVEQIEPHPVPFSSKVMLDRSEYENLAAAAKKFYVQERKESKLQKALDVATKMIEELKERVASLTAELAKYKSARGWLHTVGLEQQNELLQNKLRRYETVIDQNCLWNLFKPNRKIEHTRQEESR